MNIKELSRYYWLEKREQTLLRWQEQIMDEIKEQERRLAIFRESATSAGSPDLSGMPHGTTVGNRTESIVLQIMAYEAAVQDKALLGMRLGVEIAQVRNDAIRERMKVEEYISGIESRYLQQAFDLRFLQGYSWPVVAEMMARGTRDVESIKKACYRYIRQH